MRRNAWALVVVVAIVVVSLAWFVTTRYVIYQSGVDNVLARVDVQDPPVSAAAADAFRKLDGRAMPWLVSRSLIVELSPRPVRMGEWHLRGAVWSHLLPYRLSADQIAKLYAHYMRFEGGSGAGYGARRYFGKTPEELTAREAVALVTIYRSPHAYSPTIHPLAFQQKFRQLLLECGLPPN